VHGGPTPGNGAPSLSRSFTCLDLVVIGVAQIIGAGIFVISGVGVKIAGPWACGRLRPESAPEATRKSFERSGRGASRWLRPG